MTGKRTAAVHNLRTKFYGPLSLLTVSWGREPEEYTFSLTRDAGELDDWLSRRLEQKVTLVTDRTSGFPDDRHAYGPTVISRETLRTVASWYKGLSDEDVRRRFRPNLVIDGVPAFWEDRLYASEGSVAFRIGEVLFQGTNPCARCVVPSRDPVTSREVLRFQTTFMAKRKATLPTWAERSRFDHYYRLATNTRIPLSESGKHLRIGDTVELLAGPETPDPADLSQSPGHIAH